VGRIASFDTFPDIEIQKTFQINALSAIRIIRLFYGKLKSTSAFYCAIVSSIAGVVSSPLFSVYGATKAAVFRFIESINIELEKEGTKNRILNVCPGVLQGTSFYGNRTDFSSLQSLSRTILEKLRERDTLFIPQYDEVYHDVINRYLNDVRQFGLDSYDYKINSGRVNSAPQITVGYLSGTFDLFHIGHLNLLRRAKEYCDYLIVGVHKDALHKNKAVFIPFDERCEILKNIKWVNTVIEAKPEDMDVYKDIRYNFLFVGSDYKGTARFERYEKYFADKNVKILYFPYTHGISSTKLREILRP
jgi:glycerol-3-phosphate cytidylyltransferase